jgi:CBS domain-containing protein
MHCGELCHREVIVVQPSERASQVAKIMLENDVGTVVVVEGHGAHQRPIGMLTDRDLVLEIMANELNGEEVPVEEIMCREIILIKELDELPVAVRTMQDLGIRRLPVVDQEGFLRGIISASDIQKILARGILALAEIRSPRGAISGLIL